MKTTATTKIEEVENVNNPPPNVLAWADSRKPSDDAEYRTEYCLTHGSRRTKECEAPLATWVW